MARCAECGASVAEDGRFCSFCGARLHVVGEHIGEKILGNTETIVSALSRSAPVNRFRLIGQFISGTHTGHPVFIERGTGNTFIGDGEDLSAVEAQFVTASFGSGEFVWDADYTHMCKKCTTRYHVGRQVNLGGQYGLNAAQVWDGGYRQNWWMWLAVDEDKSTTVGYACPACSFYVLEGRLPRPQWDCLSHHGSAMYDWKRTSALKLEEIAGRRAILERQIASAQANLRAYEVRKRGQLPLMSSRADRELLDAQIESTRAFLSTSTEQKGAVEREYAEAQDRFAAFPARIEALLDYLEASVLLAPPENVDDWLDYRARFGELYVKA